jgi:restriction endonuclease Mrr
MQVWRDTTPVEWFASVVLGASISIDILANLDPSTRLGSTLSDSLGTITALADQRLRCRCNIHLPTDPSGRAQVRADVFGHEIENMGWEVHTIQTRPSMDLIIVDQSVLHAVLGNQNIAIVSAQEDAKTIQKLQDHFNELWEATSAIEESRQLLFEDLVRPSFPLFKSDIIRVSNETWNQLITHLSRSPEDLYRLEPAHFEKLVAELLHREGMEVQLTPKTRDGGRDVLALHNGSAGQHLYLVECKRYSPDRPIGVDLVRSLYGAVEQEHATAGLLVTTSRLTQDALDCATPIRYRLSFHLFLLLLYVIDYPLRSSMT